MLLGVQQVCGKGAAGAAGKKMAVSMQRTARKNQRNFIAQ